MTVPELFDVVSSETVFDGRIAKVRIDQVAMPGGGVAAREVVGHDKAVAVVALDEDGCVVLIEQYRHPLRRRLWELPAGLLDIEGEPAQEAAARELAEEVGLVAERWEVLVDLASSPGFCDEAVRVFLARGLIDTGRVGEISDEEADLTITRVPLAKAVQAVFAGQIVNAAAVAGLLAAQAALTGGLTLRDGNERWTGPALRRGDDEALGTAGTLGS